MPKELKELINVKLAEAKELGILLSVTPGRVMRNQFFKEIINPDPDSWEYAVDNALYDLVS